MFRDIKQERKEGSERPGINTVVYCILTIV